MSLNCFKRLGFFILLLAITMPALSLNWQGTGNLTQDNMTEIHNTINTYPITSSTSFADRDTVAQNISMHLNTLWDPAWNVMIVTNGPSSDSVLYGYAFRGHWMWINGVELTGAMNKLAYIIWKDYNCQGWQKRLNLAASAFTSDQVTAIKSFSFTRILTDIWADAHDFVESISRQSALSSGAYSVVMSQDAMSSFFGYICLVNSNYYAKYYLQNSNSGSYFLFQTR